MAKRSNCLSSISRKIFKSPVNTEHSGDRTMLEKAVGGLTDGLRTLKYCGDATFLNFVLIVPESLLEHVMLNRQLKIWSCC